MKELTIGEVARYAGIETSAIRYYERVGLLPPPKRLNGRNRRYDMSVLKRLGLIQLLRETGFGIREIQRVFSNMNTDTPAATHWQTLAAEKIAEMDALIKRTQATRAWLVEALQRECKGIDECVSLSFDESSQNVILCCEPPWLPGEPVARKPTQLMTMPRPTSLLA